MNEKKKLKKLVVMYQQFVDIFKRQKCVSSSLTS